jgi:hypothetical protein
MANTPTTSFEEAKEKFNLQFEEDDYVADVADLKSGPFSATTLEKYDIRTDGTLVLADNIPKGLTVHNISNYKQTSTLDLYFKEGRPLVLTFGSFS